MTGGTEPHDHEAATVTEGPRNRQCATRPLPVPPAHATLRPPRAAHHGQGPWPMDIAIVGGGIGGLTLALALHQRGIPCRVYESAPEVRELGVGITLLPHAMRELTALGLGEALAGPGHREPRELLLQPLRPAHLRGAARPGRRLPGPRGRHPSRPRAPHAVAGRDGAAGRLARPHRSPVRRPRPERPRVTLHFRSAATGARAPPSPPTSPSPATG